MGIDEDANGARSESQRNNELTGRTTPNKKATLSRGFSALTQWRRGELNPRPETAQMAASTCLVWCFDVATRVDHRQPPRATNRLRLAPRPTVESRGQPAVLQPTRHRLRIVLRLPFIRQPYEPGRQSRLGLQHRCWQLMFAHMFYQAKRASWACHHHRSHPVETDRPRCKRVRLSKTSQE